MTPPTKPVTTTFADPKVQDLWDKHKAFVYWIARRCPKYFGGCYRDYLGTLTIKFAQAAETWDENGGAKFVSYLSYHFQSYIMTRFMKYESESWDIFVTNKRATKEAKKEQQVQYTFHETDFYLYRVPDEDDDLIVDVITSFETINECWAFFTRDLVTRDRWILEQRFREDRSLQSIGDQLKITKERVRQIEARALEKIRNRLKLVTRFAELFNKRMDEQ